MALTLLPRGSYHLTDIPPPPPHPFTSTLTRPQVSFDLPPPKESGVYWWSLRHPDFLRALSLIVIFAAVTRLWPASFTSERFRRLIQACVYLARDRSASIHSLMLSWCVETDDALDLSHPGIGTRCSRLAATFHAATGKLATATLQSVQRHVIDLPSFVSPLLARAARLLRHCLFSTVFLLYDRVESRLDRFFCRHIFPIVDYIIDRMPSHVSHAFHYAEASLYQLIDDAARSRAVSVLRDLCAAIADTLIDLFPSATPDSSERMSDSEACLAEVGRGTPCHGHDVQLLPAADARRRFRALTAEERAEFTPTPDNREPLSEQAAMQVNQPDHRFHHAGSSSPPADVHSSSFESAAWPEFERRRVAARRSWHRQHGRLERRRSASPEEHVRQDDDAGVASPSRSPPLQMAIWHDDEARQAQRGRIKPVAYTFTSPAAAGDAIHEGDQDDHECTHTRDEQQERTPT